MIRTARAFFVSKLLREMVLMAGFLVLAAAVWFSSILKRTGAIVRDSHVTTSNLNEQQLWLSNRASIEAAATAAASRLDAVRTLDATKLLARVSAIATDAGLTNTTSGEAKDLPGTQFSVHTLQFNVTKVDWASLKHFYLELGKESPYIGIEQCSMQVDRSNPTLLNANFQISSVEIARN